MINTKSIYTLKLEDQKAVYLTKEQFNVYGDGIHDDTHAIQQAIDLVQRTVKYGILFIPEGKYCITDTIYVWKGIRLIGYGNNRPTFVLKENTPGFNDINHKYMIHFVSDKPLDGKPIRDANPGTFYSALNNINIEIEDGNNFAVGVRSHFAQHCFLSNMIFHIGSGLAGVDEVGNEICNCLFIGGSYGIMTTKPSPSWPFLLMDSEFEGQKLAAIRTEEGGMTIIRNQFKNVPTAVLVNPDRAEELWISDSIFENVSDQAIIISDEYNARSQYNLKNVVCLNTPNLVYFRLSKKTINNDESLYLIKDFCHGNQITDANNRPEIKTTYDIETLTEILEFQTDVKELPDCETWINIRSLGAIGDGIHDDTTIIQDAINQYNVLYFPTGRYRVTDTIQLKKETVLIGLNPIATQILITDKTPNFHGDGVPKPLILAPALGENIISGIGIDTGGINSRAIGIKWLASTNSLINDVKFIGGHGTYIENGTPVPVYNNNRLGDGNPERKWDSQYPSLWVTDQGGGTFKDIWTASPYAQAGMYVSNTSTEGRVYAMSSEHHVRYEVKLENVSNWKFFDIQMEEELGESHHCLPLYIDNCQHLLFSNLYLYRVIWTNNPYPYGVKVKESYQLEFCGIHAYSPSKYTFSNTLYDETLDYYVRSREVARLKTTNQKLLQIKKHQIEKLVSGFEFLDGLTVDQFGHVYFIDSTHHAIYSFNPKENKIKLICDAPISPIALTFDDSNQMIVVCKTGLVYTFNITNSLESLQQLVETNEIGKTCVYPGHRWRDEHNFLNVVIEKSAENYVSLDKSIYIPKSWDLFRAHSLRKANLNEPFYVADEFGQKTYKLTVKNDGTLSDPTLFTEEGEFDVVQDHKGNVYVASGYIFVYNQEGKEIDLIDIPERPTCLYVYENTLYVTAGTSLYKMVINY